MKKLILSIAAVVAFAFTTEAQTRKGTILLGAGSNLTETAWTDLQITPKVGFFVQDGVAIGAMVHFNNRTADQKFDPTNPTSSVTLSSSDMMLGAFVRYYVSNNVFAEIEVATESNKTEDYGYITAVRQTGVDAAGNPVYETNNQQEVYEESETSTNFGLGLGYTIVFKEHFALEPYVKLNLVSGDQQTYDRNLDPTESDVSAAAHDYSLSTQNFTETNFNLGVNFSLFF